MGRSEKQSVVEDEDLVNSRPKPPTSTTLTIAFSFARRPYYKQTVSILATKPPLIPICFRIICRHADPRGIQKLRIAASDVGDILTEAVWRSLKAMLT
jgi:hypothetical protein